MSIINSTGLYGDSYLFEDVQHLKTLSAEHDTLLDILEPENTTNKTNISSNISRISTLESDNTTNKTNISSNTSRISTLESDDTTNKTNISTHTTQIESLQLYDTSLNLRLQAIEGTEGTPGDTSLTIPIPAIPSTGLIALAGSVLLATGASITANGVTALTLIDMLEDKVDSNNTSAVMINRFDSTQFTNNTTTSKIEI